MPIVAPDKGAQRQCAAKWHPCSTRLNMSRAVYVRAEEMSRRWWLQAGAQILFDGVKRRNQRGERRQYEHNDEHAPKTAARF